MDKLNIQQKEAQLRLFKTYLNGYTMGDTLSTVNEDTIKSGIIFYGDQSADRDVIEIAKKLFGIKPEEWNNTFHKSFKTVLEMPIEELIAQQLIHYFTTYGLESLGIYNEKLVYIPHEKLEIPELEEDIQLHVIRQVDGNQLSEDIMKLITSGIALSKQTINDIKLLSDFIDIKRVYEISNREIKTFLYEKYDIVPSNNVEFLRYMIYKLTGETLLIKNKDMIVKIKIADSKLVYKYLDLYVNKQPDGYFKLAEIFLRYKKLFLACKRNKDNCLEGAAINKIINKLCDLARYKGYHKSVGNGLLENLTNIKDSAIFSLSKPYVKEALDKTTIFREIRIINSIAYRVQGNTSIIYKIRNKRAYADTINVASKSHMETQLEILNFIYDHLKARVNNLLKGKTVYLPDNINIMAPTSEKQYIGYLPFGSKVVVPRSNDMVIGVHWFNLENEKVDLDIHLMNMSDSYGWCSMTRSSKGDIAFSGDITDAPRPLGATELFAISRNQEPKSFLLTLNDFTGNTEEIPFEIIIASIKDINLEANYTIDPNNILVSIPCTIDPRDARKETLGLIDIKSERIEFNFNKFDMGSDIITTKTNTNKLAYDYLKNYSNTQLSLRKLLIDSGVDLKDTPEVERLEEVEITNNHGEAETLYKKVIDRVDYDLSLNKLDKTTIINLLTEGE